MLRKYATIRLCISVLCLFALLGCEKNDDINNDTSIEEYGLLTSEPILIPYDVCRERFVESLTDEDGNLSADDQEALQSLDDLAEKELEKYNSSANKNDNYGDISDVLKKGLVAFPVKYATKRANGESVQMSGCIYMTYTAWALDYRQRGYILANHYTITADKERPSAGWANESLLAYNSFVVVMSDYEGFGITSGLPQAYLCANATARQSLDLLLVAPNIVKNNIKMKNVESRLLNIGFSQGGHTTMSVLRLAETDTKYSSITFAKTYAGSGPYDIVGTYDELIKTDKVGLPAAIPLIITGLKEGLRLTTLSYSDFFQPALLQNYFNWFMSKDYDIDEIDDKMELAGLKTPKTILTSTALDKTNANTKKLLAYLDANSTLKSWPKTLRCKEIYMFHSTKDDVVPVLNTKNMETVIKTIPGVELEVEMLDFGDHLDSGEEFIKKLLFKGYIK